MKLTKYTHSCVRLDDGDNRLVLDPGVFSEVEEALEGVDAVLITHLHFDHVDAARLAVAARANPDLKIWGPSDLLQQLNSEEAFAGRLTAVGANETFVAGGLEIRTFGGQHCLIHSSIPIVSNVGFLVGGAVYHPGDSFAVPNASVEVALVPMHGPWSKTAEVIDYTVAVRSPQAYPIHDSLLTPVGQNLVTTLVTGVAAEYDTTFTHLAPGSSVSL
jgi:L-ascorbate metabolism protein UlaG (beta-lactamase superfamily)